MKRFSVKPAALMFGALLLAVNAQASITWGTPGNNSVVNSGANLGTVSASASGGFFEGNPWVDFRSSGDCLFNGSSASLDFDAGWMGTASGSASVVMNSGALTACTITLSTQDDSAQSRKYLIRQIVTLNNPGPKDDVAPDYTIFATAKTADGVANTLNGTNKFTFTSQTTSVCTVVSQDVNSAVIHNVTNGTCTVKVTAAGDANISSSGASDTESWTIVNTQGPRLALVSPPTQGISPSFVFSSTKPGTITMTPACGGTCTDNTAEIGNNTCKLASLTLGQTYTGCTVTVTNGSLSGTLTLADFKITENVSGPGGVGAVDGSASSTMELWLNGNGLPMSGSISTWTDLSGKGRNFAAGVAPTVSTLNGFRAANFLYSANTRMTYAGSLLPRSLFFVYSDNSGATAAVPFSNQGYWWHSDVSTVTYNTTYAHTNVQNGYNSINGGASFTGTGPARPGATHQIHSRIMATGVPTNNQQGTDPSANSNYVLGSDRSIANRSINGDIAEIFAFSNALNAAQRIIIENYLSAKYNIALAANSVYPYGGSDLYKYDVAGIGRASDGSFHANARGAQVQMSNPIGLDNTDFLLWGHDNDDLALQLTDVPNLVPQRLTRRWRVSNRNVAGTTNVVTGVDVKFHVSELPGFLDMCMNFNNIVLLIDADGAFASGATIRADGAYDPTTNTVTWANVSIPHGSFMTFGVGGDGTSVYVKPTASGKKDGSSWANACTLESALTSPRLLGDTVKMAAGVHRPTRELSIRTGMTVQGGYAGVSESEVSDPAANMTIVTGDLDYNDDLLNSLVMYHRDIRGTNLARLFNISNVTSTTYPVTLDGLYLTGMSQLSNHGSVVWQQNSRVFYKNLNVFGNRAREMGGAFFINDGSIATITNSTFLGNVAEHGGAIQAKNGSTVTATNTSFTNNQSLLLANRSNPAAVNVGKAVSINGYNNVITTSSATPTNTFTVEAWVKSDNFTHEIDAENNSSTLGTSGQRYLFFPTYRDSPVGTSSGMGFSVGTNGISVYEHAPGYMPALAVHNATIGTQWNHIAIVYNNRVPTIYLNGTAVRTGVTSAKTTVYAPYEMGLGGYGGFSGQVDEIRLWNVARSAADIQANMYREIANPALVGNLVGYWQLNDNYLDSSNYGNHGVVSAAAPLFVNGNVPNNPAAVGWNRFRGGAVDISSGSKLNVANSTFIGNNVYNSDNNAVVAGSQIRGTGGAISLSDNEAPSVAAATRAASNQTELTVTDTVFSYNSSRDGGGAISAMPGFKSINIDNATFDQNTATRPISAASGSVYWGTGGAIHALGSPTSGFGAVTITDTEFTSNTAAELGGAVFFSGNYPDADSNYYMNASISRSAFVGNKANYGAGFFAWQFSSAPSNHTLTVNNSTFTENVAVGYGGGLAAVNGARLTVNHATIYKNTVNGGGGTGGGIYFRDTGSVLNLKNSIVVDNTAASGKNIYNTLAVTSATDNLVGYNNAAGWYNTSAEIANANTVGSNNITASVANVNQIINTVLATNGGITRNFVLSSNGGVGSPAFNKIPLARCLSEDQRAVSRTAFTNCDMGSYETSKVDTDGDAKVDAIDNCPTLVNAGQEDLDADSLGDVCDSDKDGDGVANTSDYFPAISLNVGGTNRLDTDNDGIPDTCDSACSAAGMYADADKDNDSVLNTADNCPAVANADQSDIDGDAVIGTSGGDVCDSDMDGDGFANTSDNCPGITNPLQTDSDGNGLGDDCNAMFVKPVASGMGDCSSWENACAGGTGTQLQAAIDRAVTMHAVQVYMAEGIYRPSATVNLAQEIIIYGGFKGVDEIYHYQADPANQLTIITGDVDSNDAVDSNGITQSYAHQSGTNLARIFNANTLGTGADKVAAINGVIITGAGSTSALHATASRLRINKVKFFGNKGATGGALFVEGDSKLVVTDSEFSANQATAVGGGGALYATGTATEVSMSQIDFSGNRAITAGAAGGAVSVTAGARVSIGQSAMFDNQAADNGGAIQVDGATSLTVNGTTFSGNRTTTATANAGGAAVRIQGAFGTVYIGTSSFLQNSSAQQGGAVMVWNNSAQAKSVTMEDVLFKTNTAANVGGAVSIGNSSGANTVTISRASFVSNTGTTGGAIQLAGDNSNQLAVDNATFYDNRSTTNTGGGAVYMTGGADAALTHVTLLQNKANNGTGNSGGIRVDNTGSVLTLKNSLVIDNQGTAAEGSNIGITGSGNYTDSGYNLIGFGAASGLKSGGTVNRDPATVNATSKRSAAAAVADIIAPALTDYGGLFYSIAITSTVSNGTNGMARDAIPNGVNGCVTDAGYDERGFNRPDMIDVTDPDQDGDIRNCDIGAFEFNNAYRVDCFAEDGLRPDQGSGYGVYYCEDGTNPTPGELANNVFVGRVDYLMLVLMMFLGAFRRGIVKSRKQ